MEVLMAYVWENAPWPPESSEPPERGFIKPPEGSSVSDSMSNEAPEEDKDAEQDAQFPTPPTDIQAILEVLKRRAEERVPEKHRVLVDFQRTDLRGATLAEAKLRGAILRGAHLEGADLRDAHLQEALLRDAHLEGALLDGANLEEAHLVRVHLEGATLWGTNLQRANLADAHLEGAGLLGANLVRADLNEAYLEGARLVRVHLDGANFSGAHLEGAIGLTPEQIEWTIGDEKTELPEYLIDHRPPAWSKSLEEQIKIIRERLKPEPKDE